MNTKLFTFFALFCMPLLMMAQESLPYSTSFETQAERDAWEQFRMGETAFYDWDFVTAPMAYPSHDYPVGAGSTDTTQDWLVSPQIHFHSTSKLALSVNIFTMIGTMEADRFEIWFSTGEKDPAEGDYQMIADLTETGGSGIWQDTAGIVIPDTGMGYLAFVYQTNWNWITVAFDSIEITPDTPLSVAGPHIAEMEWRFHSAQRSLGISQTLPGDMILLYDLTGAVLRQARVSGTTHLLDLSDINNSVILAACFRNGERISSEKLVLKP